MPGSSFDSTGDSIHLRVDSAQSTLELGQLLGNQIDGGEVFALTGELGTGKTVLVRGMAIGLGIPSDHISSPTFTLIQEYAGSIHVIHMDLYRLTEQSDISSLGVQDYMTSENLVLIEWPDRLSQELPLDHMAISLEHGDTQHSRFIQLCGTGPQHATLATKIKDALKKQGWPEQPRP